jgi:flagellar biogenesis protein FliO
MGCAAHGAQAGPEQEKLPTQQARRSAGVKRVNPVLLKIIAIFLVTVLLVKRSLIGPQPIFARVALAMLTTGGVVVVFTAGENPIALMAALILMLGGILITLAMKLVEVAWVIRRFLSKRSGG